MRWCGGDRLRNRTDGVKRREQEFFSVEGEPALSGKADLELDPAERKVVRREELERRQTVAEIDALRDSVLSEPSLDAGTAAELGSDRADFGDWLAVRKLRVGVGSLVLVTLLAGLAGGPFAIVGALMKSGLGGINIILWASYAIVLGPNRGDVETIRRALLARAPTILAEAWLAIPRDRSRQCRAVCDDRERDVHQLDRSRSWRAMPTLPR